MKTLNQRAEVKGLEMVDRTHAVAIAIYHTRILKKNMYVIFDVKDNRICSTLGCSDKKDRMIEVWNDWKNRMGIKA